jgi:hypothetical protein
MSMRRKGHHRRLAVPVTVIAAVALLAGCAKAAEEGEAENRGAEVEAIKGSELSRVTLTKAAARRLDLHTQAVGASAGSLTPVSYNAILYDPEGVTWVFVGTSPLTFVRKRVAVDHVDGDVAYLTSALPARTDVVTVGATQLYGAESGVGEDE